MTTNARAQRRRYSCLMLAISLGLFGVADLSEVWWSLRFANYGLIALGIPIHSDRANIQSYSWSLLLLPLGSPSITASFGSMI
jgi:hypothetical protein